MLALFFPCTQAGYCSNEDACAYCHLPHPQKAAKLDKRQRQAVHSLYRPQLCALVLQLCQAKAEEIWLGGSPLSPGPKFKSMVLGLTPPQELGMLTQVQEIMQLLQLEAENAPLPPMDRENRGLCKALARMKLRF